MSKISMPAKIFGTVLSHGLRGRMLTKSELQVLAEARDMEELVTRIKKILFILTPLQNSPSLILLKK